MNQERIKDTCTASLAGRMTFPEVVQILSEEGVESYQVDLVQKIKTFYMPHGEVISKTFDYQGPAIAAAFSHERVLQAIRSIQKKEINYREFLNQIMQAGTSTYTVYLHGKKAIYFGRHGDFHVENFPQTQSVK